MHLLQQILKTLNSSNPASQSALDSSVFSDIIRNNQVLSRAIEQAERRCTSFEKKLARKAKYETQVKNCLRLECKECGKLYTPGMFSQHVPLCKRQSRPSVEAAAFNNQ